MKTRPTRSSSATARRGFTLIELLTVIAIIGILAAILIPTVGTVRKMGKRSQGLSSIRQVTMTAINFINDNRGRFVYDHEHFEKSSPILVWSKVLTNYTAKAPYTKAVDRTPDWFRDPLATPTPDPTQPADHHYAPFQFFTSTAADSNGLSTFRGGAGILKVKSPAKQVFFADIFVDEKGATHGDIHNGPNVGWMGGWVDKTSTNLNRTVPATYGSQPGQIDFTRDSNQAKFGFLDGHVKIFKREDFQERYLNPFAP